MLQYIEIDDFYQVVFFWTNSAVGALHELAAGAVEGGTPPADMAILALLIVHGNFFQFFVVSGAKHI